MKKFNWLSMLLACMAIGMMSSCLGDDNNYEEEMKKLREQMKQEIAAAQGQYSGFIYYMSEANHEKDDSLATTWSMENDSTIIAFIPAKALASSVENNELSKLLANSDGVGRLNIHIPGYVGVSPLWFYVEPLTVKFQLNPSDSDEDASQEVTANFDKTVSNEYSIGYFYIANKLFVMQLSLKNITVGSQSWEFDATRNAPYFLWKGNQTFHY